MEKYKNLNVAAKAVIWFSVCNIIIKGVGLITAPLFTRLLEEAEYGKLSIFVSYEQLFLILATWEIQLGAYQKGVFNYKDDMPLFTAATLLLTNTITIILFIPLFVANNHIENVTGISKGILILLFVLFIVQPGYSCWVIRKRTSYEYRRAVSASLLYTFFNVVTPIVAILLIEKSAKIKYVFTLIPTIVWCLFFYIRSLEFRKIRKCWIRVKEYWKYLIRYQGPLVFHSLSYMVLSQMDRIMIGIMVGEEQAAFYSIAYTIASVLIIVQAAINQALTPWRYEKLEKGEYNIISQNTSLLLIVFSLLICLEILVMPEIMLIFPNSYYEAVWSMPPITVSVYFMFLYSAFVNIETYYEETKYVTYVSVTCGIVNIVTNYLLIELFGYIVCGYTTLFSYILFAIGHYWFMKKVLKKNGVRETVFDTRVILFMSVGVIAFSIIVTVLYSFPIIRYLVLCLILLLTYVNREIIKEVLEIVKN